MPINSRAKGATGEREFAALIHDHLGVKLRRNLEQSRQGGHDLTTEGDDPISRELDRYAIEVKRWSSASPGTIKAWWRQAVHQAGIVGKLPALAFREDRQEWAVVIPLFVVHPFSGAEIYWAIDSLNWTVRLSLDGFAAVVREMAG